MKTAVPNETTFVTWADCFYPEDAHVTSNGNPLRTVYAEALDDLPVAHAVPVSELPQAQVQEGPSAPPVPQGLEVPPCNPPVFTGTGNNSNPTKDPPHDTNTKEGSDFHDQVSNTSFGLDLLIGSILCFTAVTTVLCLELTGWIVYLVAASFWHMNKVLEPPNLLTGLLYGLFALIYWILVLMDSLLLLISVLVSELIAAIGCLVSCLLAGCSMAAQWHQFIRKTCHKLRWAFRSICTHPQRHFCGRRPKKQGEEMAVPRPSVRTETNPIAVTFDEPMTMYGE